MKELTSYYKRIAEQGDAVKTAASIFAVARLITPQFYKSMTDGELQAELASIALLITGIRKDILAKMCELAVKDYGKSRAKNSKQYFDINYILTFSSRAWEEAQPERLNWYIGDGRWTSVDYVDLDKSIDEIIVGIPPEDIWVDERLMR